MPKGVRIGGRQKGTPNKVSNEARQLAGVHGPDAIERLAWLLKNGEPHAVQVSAARELLDRAYGKAPQPQTGADGEGPIVTRVIYSWDDGTEPPDDVEVVIGGDGED